MYNWWEPTLQEEPSNTTNRDFSQSFGRLKTKESLGSLTTLAFINSEFVTFAPS